MKMGQIFRGNIRICTKNFKSTSTIYKEDAILIKLRDDEYVDLERINSILDYIKLFKDSRKMYYPIKGLIMPTIACGNNHLFVDEKTLRPYDSDKQENNKISLHQLKKELKSTKNKNHK